MSGESLAFFVYKKHFRFEYTEQNELPFCVGTVCDEYTLIFKDVLGIILPNCNNYVPVRELAGAVQHIEKYIYCLNAWGKDGEQKFQKQLSGKPVALKMEIDNN